MYQNGRPNSYESWNHKWIKYTQAWLKQNRFLLFTIGISQIIHKFDILLFAFIIPTEHHSIYIYQTPILLEIPITTCDSI